MALNTKREITEQQRVEGNPYRFISLAVYDIERPYLLHNYGAFCELSSREAWNNNTLFTFLAVSPSNRSTNNLYWKTINYKDNKLPQCQVQRLHSKAVSSTKVNTVNVFNYESPTIIKLKDVFLSLDRIFIQRMSICQTNRKLGCCVSVTHLTNTCATRAKEKVIYKGELNLDYINSVFLFNLLAPEFHI